MGKRLLRIFAAILIVGLAVSLFSGCAGSNQVNDSGQNETQNDSKPSPEPAESTPEPNAEPVEITWGIHFQAPAVIPDTPVQQWLEQKFNVKIKPVKVTDASIASGEIPDIFTLGDASNVAAYQAQGVLMSIDPAGLQEKMPEYYQDIANTEAKALFNTVTFNGELWAMPMFVDIKPYDFALLWRKDWLDTLGIEKVPESLEEFEQAVYAFAKQDPDGNGKHDTYGLTGTMTTTWSSGFFSIFGAFGVQPTMWHEKDGNVDNGSVMPQTKEALAILRKWYADGVIDPEFITDTQDSYRKKLYNNRIGLIEESIGRAALDDSSTIAEMKAANPDAKLILGKNPKGPGGDGSWDWGIKSNFVVIGSHVKDDPEKLQKLYEILKAQSTDEETINMTGRGIKGTHWDFVESGAASGATKFLPGFEKPEQRDVAGVRLFSLGSITTRAIRGKYENPDLTEKVRTYSSAPRWSDAILYSALPSDGKYKKELTLLMQKYFAEIIKGERPLEDFDKFVEEWKTNGGETLTQEANELYRTQFKK
ncbi:extracellular solute-binding protein [Paenibacillus alkalitolerans]|uniref:extracellular solute-binding protein n=1 Tax=Paenibacillus alkalitolerans TaxID=2799335 RepID=UPI0018F30EED|nr:extracellular solute-binding protein [Paenibacillus alkalitolerans]